MMQWWLALNKLSTGSIHRLWDSPKMTLNVARYLTKGVRSILAGEPLMRIARRRSLVLLAVLCIVGTTPAKAVSQTDLLKLYAHSRLVSMDQFKCFDALITKESNWRVDAKNGSHYGIGQMRNNTYRRLDGFNQVDWSIRYITKRYGSMCNGWRFFKLNGYH
jgi:hypothetical protein